MAASRKFWVKNKWTGWHCPCTLGLCAEHLMFKNTFFGTIAQELIEIPLVSVSHPTENKCIPVPPKLVKLIWRTDVRVHAIHGKPALQGPLKSSGPISSKGGLLKWLARVSAPSQTYKNRIWLTLAWKVTQNALHTILVNSLIILWSERGGPHSQMGNWP